MTVQKTPELLTDGGLDRAVGGTTLRDINVVKGLGGQEQFPQLGGNENLPKLVDVSDPMHPEL